MYIRSISIQDVRTLRKADITFQVPNPLESETTGRLTNVNLILGNNGAGKSSILRCIALAALGPVAQRLPLYRMVRWGRTSDARSGTARIQAKLELSPQDLPESTVSKRTVVQKIRIHREGSDFEALDWSGDKELWKPAFESRSPGFFVVGYGATRRVEIPRNLDISARSKTLPARAQRVQGLFEDSWSLVPLGIWLPELEKENKGRFIQVIRYIARLLPPGCGFDGKREPETGEYLFLWNGVSVPFPALSDGLKAFIGWVADLLYYVCFTCPSGHKLVENRGIVLVDEIDLHLHPEWQRIIVPKLAAAFPNLQFIFTTHSPLVVGSLSSQNLWLCSTDEDEGITQVQQPRIPVRGLNSDQILLTQYFGIGSSRAPEKEAQLDEIAKKAEGGDKNAAREFVRQLVKALPEDGQEPKPDKPSKRKGSK